MASFKLNFCPVIKLFDNASKITPLNVLWTINVDTIEDMISEIWLNAEPYLKRQIHIDPLAKTHSFSEKEKPDPSDIVHFVKIRDPIGKHTFKLDTIPERYLELWNDGRELSLFIFPHSHDIQYRSEWDAINKGPKALIKPVDTDKSGAPSESSVETMVDRLKEMHRYNYTGMYIHWRTWAEYILKKGGENDDALVQRPPPPGILKLFETAHSDSRAQILSIRENVNIAEGINDGIAEEFKGIISGFDNVLRLSEIKLEAEKAFKQKLDAFQQKINNNRQNLVLFGTAHQPRETELSQDYFSHIGLQDDVDHLIEFDPTNEDRAEEADNVQVDRYGEE